MSDSPFYFNNSILQGEKLSRMNIEPSNRGFKYGDGFFETLRFQNGRILFLEKHDNRMRQSCRILGLSHSDLPSLSAIEKLMSKKWGNVTSRIRLTFYRQEGGGYAPSTSSLGWMGESVLLTEDVFSFGTSGLHTEVYEEGRKLAFGALSNVKSLNAQLYVHAGRFANKKNLREVLVLNQYYRVCEGVQSNLFLVKEGKLITPSLEEGPVNGVMRAVVMDLARDQGVTVEESGVSVMDVQNADEVFFTNTIRGIQWCVGFGDKRYKTRLAKELHLTLNRLV